MLTDQEYVQWARAMGVNNPEIIADLLPIIMNLKDFARRLEELAPEFNQEINPENFSKTALGK